MGNITNAGLSWLRDYLDGNNTASNGKYMYMAWGTDSTPNPAPNTLTQLNAEVGRKAITSFSPGAAGILDTILYMAALDAAGVNIGEVGFFVGPTATSSPNTGVMVSRILYSHSKTNIESIQFDLKDILTGS